VLPATHNGVDRRPLLRISLQALQHVLPKDAELAQELGPVRALSWHCRAAGDCVDDILLLSERRKDALAGEHFKCNEAERPDIGGGLHDESALACLKGGHDLGCGVGECQRQLGRLACRDRRLHVNAEVVLSLMQQSHTVRCDDNNM
jgi:hypothetical protein